MNSKQLHDYLQNPENIGDNLVPAHSDHSFYEKVKEAEADSYMPLKQSLNGTWKFKYSVNLKERPADFYKEDYSLKGFGNIKVPGHIEMQGYDQIHYTNTEYPWDGTEALMPPQISETFAPVGSYIKEFKVGRNLKGKKLFISFQGVEVAFRVWLNGQYIGYSEDSFTPAEFEITKFVTDSVNRLAVEVYKRTSASWLEDQDMWRFFGIFREVFLYAVPKLHVSDIFARATLDDKYEKGVLRLEAKLMGHPDKTEVRVVSASGKCVLKSEGNVEGDKLTVNAAGLNIKPWSAETPNLYKVFISLYDKEGAHTETAVTTIGFRTFELKDKIMLLNGKRILFKGVNRHEFSCERGRVVSKEEMLWDIITFKRNNINAVRTSHYPNSSLWYKLCDEYGIYMIDETNLETHGTWGTDDARDNHKYVPGSHPEWKAAVMERASNMFNRDKNHPAVLMWSLGNESYGGDNFVYMHDYFREVDDTRIVHYEGIVHDPDETRRAKATDVHSNMYAKPDRIRQYLSNNPDKPYISCEYMHAMGNSLGGMKLYTDLEDEFPMYQGGFIWDYLDQAIWQKHNGKTRLAYGGDFGDRPTEYCFCTDGIVFADRRESPKCAEAKNLYANVHLTVDENGFTVENRNLFIDLSRYYFEYVATENGKTVFTTRFSGLATAPGAKETVSVKVRGTKAGRDHVYRVSMHEKHRTPWCTKGYMVAFAEKNDYAEGNPVIPATDRKKKFVHTADGLGNAGCVGENFSYIYSKWNGPVSLKKDGREYITTPPKPTFFRAFTDNDRGYKLGQKAIFWDNLSRYGEGRLKNFEQNEEFIEAVYEYALPDAEPHCSVTYKTYADGKTDVTIHYFGREGRHDMPLFGWEIKLDKSYDFVEYYGKGPEENYRDRNNGAYTDLHYAKVGSNLTPYLVPQEAGNRTDVRYAFVTDKDGHGFMFAAQSGTFELGFLPYSAFEIENALHIDELPERNYSWIRIMAGQMGVGGDDSWGAPVQSQFTLDATKDMELKFTILPL
ncbi:MAG: DUF4981 domain-containing protein [Lachnospiraceae bacterium]|nr:DUF4981 domain-containing protein [Lachnospiraceae bacterium]